MKQTIYYTVCQFGRVIGEYKHVASARRRASSCVADINWPVSITKVTIDPATMKSTYITIK